MPQSTNAPFNNLGFAQVLRDIELLYLKLQEYANAGAQGGGDLNPGGGTGLSQQVPQDGWGPAGMGIDSALTQGGLAIASGSAGNGGSMQGLARYMVLQAINPGVVLAANIFSNASNTDTLTGWNATTARFTAPTAGWYFFAASAIVYIVGSKPGYMTMYLTGPTVESHIASTAVDTGGTAPLTDGNPSLSLAAPVRLNAGATVDLYFYNGTAFVVNVSGTLAIVRLGDL